MKSANTMTVFKRNLLAMGLAAISPAALAVPLSIADNALEIATGVEPNILMVTDDSGSMDWGIMSPDSNGLIQLGYIYYYTHPVPGATGNAPSVNDYFWVTPDPVFLAANGVAAPQGGAWRAWNHNYNGIYYNPDITYVPWKGLDVNGATYGNASATAAPYNPYRPADGNVDLTNTLSYTTDCGATDCVTASFTGPFTVTNFYPARYYTWTDNNPADGVVDAADGHTLVEIKSANFPKTRPGTRTDCGSGATVSCTYAQEIQNFANWFSYYRKRDLATKAAFSRSLESATSARIGLATLNSSTNRIPVASMNISPDTGNKLSLYDKIFSTRPNGGTPLRLGLEKAGNYFACRTSNSFGTAASSPGNTNCPVQASPAGNCQQNYSLLMTDGFWNGGNPATGNEDTGTGDFTGGSFADGFTDTLADVAMYYYKTDLHSGLVDDVPTTTIDINRYLGSTDPFETMHQHMATYTIGFGVNGTLTTNPPDVATAFAWPNPTAGDPQKIDDMRHAAWNGRGQFLSAGDPDALTTSLETILSEIAAGTGAASSVAFNTQNLESGALVFRAFFDTTTDTGDMVAQPVTITGDVLPAEVWSAAAQLDGLTSTSSDTRKIISYNPTTTLGIPFQWADMDATQQGLLNLPQVNAGASPDPLGQKRLAYLRGQSENEGSSLVSGQFRVRKTSKGKLGDIVHSSPVFVGQPPFLGRDAAPYPDASFSDYYSQFSVARKTRRESIYVGANDGMLHSFDANTGAEIFAYVPNVLYGELSKLADPDYTHQFYVDASPSINDIFFTPARGTNASAATWNTVLVGGLGAGGNGYFALNITDPADLATETAAKDNVLWEFTAADDTGGAATGNDLNLGLTFSEPLIAMSNISDGTNQRWVAIFGNGYNSTSTDGDAELYIVFIDAGQDGTWTRGTDFIKLTTGKGKAESADTTTPNGISGIRGIDVDLNGTVDVVYAGDLQGNMYRFDLSATTVGGIAASSVQTLYSATYSGDGSIQPITNAPIVVKHPSETGYIVIFGTGSYITTADATSTGIQSIYGLWDDFTLPSDSITTVTTSRLQEQTFTNIASPVNGFTVRTLTNTSITWGHNGTKKEGWFIDLDVPVAGGGAVEFPGERAIRNFQIRGNFLFVNTVIPKASTACNTGPGGFELGFDPVTGGSTANPVFDTNSDGVFDTSDNVGATAGATNVTSGLRFDDATPTDSSFIGNRKVTQTSDKKIRSTGTNTDGGKKTGRHSWREIEL